MVLDLKNMQRQAAESDAEREFERVIGMPK
jgi:hypothetical protein